MTAPASDRVALVTGASSGIGRALSRLLLSRHWTVIGAARRVAPFTHASYHHLQLDLSDLPALVQAMEQSVAPRIRVGGWKRIGLVNNAASADGLAPLSELDIEDLQRIHAVNAVAPIWLMGFLVRMREPGVTVRIANVSSGAATQGFPGLAAYGAAKAALRLAGMSLAAEWESGATGAPEDGAILSYEPGLVDTEMQERARSVPPSVFPWVSMFKDFAAGGLLQPPEAPAVELADFLASERQPRFAERRLGA